MKALVLEKKQQITLREIDINEAPGPKDVRIEIKAVGVCGSDVHYYQHGRIGPYVVNDPMVLGHEAAGIVVEIGSEVTGLKVGDRVCMEPGIPDFNSRATLEGMYNLDPGVVFWATPPVHGCLRSSVVHPAALTFKLPDSVSFAEGAMIEPLAIGMQAADKAAIKPGDVAVVTGAGTIGVMTALSALAGGCSDVFITDVRDEKLDIISRIGPFKTVNVARESIEDRINQATDGWGADIVFEASGNAQAAAGVFDLVCPGGTVVFIGCPLNPVPLDLIKAMSKEVTMKTVFRYANMYARAIALMGSSKISVKPLITDVFSLEDGIKAFEYAANMKPTSVKVMITL